MSKQIMIYDNIQPLSEKHLTWSVDVQDYGFISHLSAVPLLAAELPLVAPELPIIFLPLAKEGEFTPLAMLGLIQGQNLVLNDKKHLTIRYVPGFIRRYPFILGGNESSDTMAVCIDEDSKACFKDGSKGYKLFDENKEQTQTLKSVGEFLQDYYFRAESTKIFCRSLFDLGLLEPMTAEVTLADKSKINLSGFYVVSREKLKVLSDADALDLFKKDGLELIYAHLQSLNNINRLMDLMQAKS